MTTHDERKLFIGFIVIIIVGSNNVFSYSSIPYAFPMEIGDTFDIKTGGSLINIYNTSKGYYLTRPSNLAEVSVKGFSRDEAVTNSFLVSGHLGVSASFGVIGVSVSGSFEYSKKTDDAKKVNDWFGKVTFTKKTQFIQDPTENIRENCRDIPSNLMGTHYIRSVQFGRDMIVRANTISTSTLSSELIGAGAGVGATVFGVTAEVSASYSSQTTNIEQTTKTDVSVIADGVIPFLPVTTEDCGMFVDKWTEANYGKPTLPKVVEVAAINADTTCNSVTQTNDTPLSNSAAINETTNVLYSAIETRINDFESAIDQINGFIQQLNYGVIGTNYDTFLTQIYNMRKNIILSELTIRNYVEDKLLDNFIVDYLDSLMNFENEYKNSIPNSLSSWDDSINYNLQVPDSKSFCPQNFIYNKGICYLISDIQASPDAAAGYCSRFSSELLYIRYEDEYTYITETLDKLGKENNVYMLNGHAVPGKPNEFAWSNSRIISLSRLSNFQKCSTRCITNYNCILLKKNKNVWGLEPGFCYALPENYFICSRLLL